MIKDFEGKTVEEAVEVACRELNLTTDDFSYEVKELPTRGFLGIGAKNAVITVTIDDDPKNYLSNYLRELFGFMNVTGYTESIEITEDKLINIQLNGDILDPFTERHSDIVDAIQFMLAITVNKKYDEHYKVTFNVNDYKEKSVSRVEAIAVKTAKVEIFELRVSRGMGGKGMVLITGDVGDVTAAVEAGAQHAQDQGLFCNSAIIAAPHEALWEQI